MAIWQDLVDTHGFDARYSSVRLSMERRGRRAGGAGAVRACRHDARNKGGTHGPSWRMRGRKLVAAPLHGVACLISRTRVWQEILPTWAA
jgi:hypothetical protein